MPFDGNVPDWQPAPSGNSRRPSLISEIFRFLKQTALGLAVALIAMFLPDVVAWVVMAKTHQGDLLWQITCAGWFFVVMGRYISWRVRVAMTD
jgi:hypothetical protein